MRARQRRTKHSSSDSSVAGNFLVSNVKFRVAAPPARSLPNENRWNEDCTRIRDCLGFALENGLASIITDNGIETAGRPPKLVYRCIEESPSDGQPTMLVVATWDETSSPSVWERAVKQAKQFINATSLASGQLDHVDIGVEIIAEQLDWANYVSCVPNSELTDSLIRDWDTAIQDDVAKLLESFPQTKGKVTSMAVFKLGPLRDVDSNPLVVYISINYESEEDEWPPVVSEIQRYLDRYEYGLRVHIEHGSPKSFFGLFD